MATRFDIHLVDIDDVEALKRAIDAVARLGKTRYIRRGERVRTAHSVAIEHRQAEHSACPIRFGRSSAWQAMPSHRILLNTRMSISLKH
jgi:hypothetical protein